VNNFLRQVCFFLLFIFLFISCENDSGDDNIEKIKTGRITFVNESSYRLMVRRDSIIGSVITEMLASDFSKTVDVRVSDNNWLGTTFTIEYLVTLPSEILYDSDSTEVYASGFDINVQINRVVEENKTIQIIIPQPQNLESNSSFISIKNTSNLPGTFCHYGQSILQINSNLVPITSGKTGIFLLNNIAMGGIPLNGSYDFTNLSVISGSSSILVPNLTARNGIIYRFTFNGSTVVKDGEISIVY